jgi:hypothetical protein
MFITVARCCSDCGGDTNVLVTSITPTPEQINKLHQETGGYCVKMHMVEIPDHEWYHDLQLEMQDLSA